MNRHDIILRPLLTEKSTSLREALNKFSFVVRPGTNRKEVKRAVEETLNVKVEKVHILNVAGKKKRLGRFTGMRSDWRKAIVTLRKGEKLELFEG